MLFLVSCKTKKSTRVEKVPYVVTVEELYSRSCSQCHDLPEKTDYKGEEWMPILKDMQRRSHLSDRNIQDIYVYLTTESEE